MLCSWETRMFLRTLSKNLDSTSFNSGPLATLPSPTATPSKLLEYQRGVRSSWVQNNSCASQFQQNYSSKAHAAFQIMEPIFYGKWTAPRFFLARSGLYAIINGGYHKFYSSNNHWIMLSNSKEYDRYRRGGASVFAANWSSRFHYRFDRIRCWFCCV